MRHPFRTWLEGQDIAEAALTLFDEGLTCYSAGAYRAALVFSYLGLLRAVAQRLMLSERPPEFPSTFWDQMQRSIRDDMSWEEETLEALMRVKLPRIFVIHEDTRQQLQYWRGRRNDAAHARSNEIGAPHVESLWLFVRSNLSRLIPAGSRAGLFEQFRQHFDPTLTARDSDLSPLVSQIPQALTADEYSDFLAHLLQLTGDRVTSSEDLRISDHAVRLIQHILSLGDARLAEALAETLQSDRRLLLSAILKVPRLTILYSRQKAFVRDLWSDQLPFINWKDGKPVDLVEPSFEVLAFMMRNGVIPEGHWSQAFGRALERLQERPSAEYSERLLKELGRLGLWDAVPRVLAKLGAAWLSDNLTLSLECLKRSGADFFMARSFAELVSRDADLEKEIEFGGKFLDFEEWSDLRVHFTMHPKQLDGLLRVAKNHRIDISRFEALMRYEKLEELMRLQGVAQP